MKPTILSGTVPILATAFAQDGQLDLRSQESLTEHLLSQRVHGLGLFANASEGYALTVSERRKLLGVIAMRARGQTGGFMPDAMSGVDLALWDAVGKCLERSVSTSLGSARR